MDAAQYHKMKLGKKRLIILFAAVLLVGSAAVGYFMWSRQANKPAKPAPLAAGNVNSTFNDAKSFDEIDAKIDAYKCNEVTAALNKMAQSKQPLEKALAQVRLGDCYIQANKQEEAVKQLEPAVKYLESIRYVTELPHAQGQLDRARAEAMSKKEKDLIKPKPKPTTEPSGPIL